VNALTKLLAEIAERCAKATPGQWDLNLSCNPQHTTVVAIFKNSENERIFGLNTHFSKRMNVTSLESLFNAAFVAHAREDIPRLIKALDHEMETSRAIWSGEADDNDTFLSDRHAELAHVLEGKP
jgi:hypothetical protein